MVTSLGLIIDLTISHHRQSATAPNINPHPHIKHFNDTCGYQAGAPILNQDVLS